MMTVIAKQYSQWWVKYPAYLFGLSVALQRMDDRQHWMTDVLVGGGIGYWVGNTLANRSRHSALAARVTPVFSASRLGVTVQF